MQRNGAYNRRSRTIGRGRNCAGCADHSPGALLGEQCHRLSTCASVSSQSTPRCRRRQGDFLIRAPSASVAWKCCSIPRSTFSSRKCCSSQILLVHEPEESTTYFRMKYDAYTRKVLYGNVVFSGSTTKFHEFSMPVRRSR